MKHELLFVSDTHLSPERADILDRFIAFLREDAMACRRLYILGDLFDFWHGDDERHSPWLTPLIEALGALHRRGIEVYFMNGNRDFLLGKAFCGHTHMTLLPDPCVIDYGGRRILLSHGDQFCTLDRGYQLWRRLVHSRALQWLFLRLPLRLRQRLAARVSARLRAGRGQGVGLDKAKDAVPDAIRSCLGDYPADLVIHGHTHLPRVHQQESADGKLIERIVLGDWPKHDNVVALGRDGYSRYSIELA